MTTHPEHPDHPEAEPLERYDRAEASAVLARLAQPGLFAPRGEPMPEALLGPQRTVRYRMTALPTDPDSPLAAMRVRYREKFMQPCPLEAVTFATHHVVWDDSDGVPNVAHVGPSGLGPVVPIVAREATLALWRALAANERLDRDIAALSAADREVLSGTTTDREPLEILRIGVEATSRALVQHAYLADQTPHRTAADFARAMLDSGVFTVVASTWYWELQAATLRRGMIPVSFAPSTDGALRYTSESVALLRAMKDRTVATAHEVMRRAIEVEGMTPAQAVQKYHYEDDVIAKQYALLPESEQPRCLGTMATTVGGARYSALPDVAQALVTTFVRLLDRVELSDTGEEYPLSIEVDPGLGLQTKVFHVPDMNCSHCKMSITGLLTSLGITVLEINLETKRVVVDLPSIDLRDQAFGAIRSAGYTVVAPGRT